MANFTSPSSKVLALLLCSVVGAACAAPRSALSDVSPEAVPADAETLSFLGEPLRRLPLAPEVRTRREELISNRKKICEDCPEVALTFIAWGRALGTAHRYREAVDVFTQGLARHSEDVKLLRFRGHRWITLRRPNQALADLTRAAELAQNQRDEPEEDAEPQPGKAPTATIHHNIYYHLGLARYLRGEFEEAARAFKESLRLARTNEALSGSSYWTANALLRAGRMDEAMAIVKPVDAKWKLTEGQGYRDLCLVYRGDLKPEELLSRTPRSADSYDFPTVGNGIAAYYLATGRESDALALWRECAAHPFWPAFGRIVAEAELARTAQSKVTAPSVKY